MEFTHEAFVEREIEIAHCLLLRNTLNEIAIKTGISKRQVSAHIRNMMTKLKVKNAETLMQSLQIILKN